MGGRVARPHIGSQEDHGERIAGLYCGWELQGGFALGQAVPPGVPVFCSPFTIN